jgi:hypothetical protein
MRAVLEGVVECVAPGNRNLVKRHVWRNPDYVGMAGNKVAVWEGWSANLAKVDPRFKSIYIDYAENGNSLIVNEALFGSAFAHRIQQIQPFIFLFVTSCREKDSMHFIERGFTYRQINAVIHPGVLTGVPELFSTSIEMWSAIGSELLYLQYQTNT